MPLYRWNRSHSTSDTRTRAATETFEFIPNDKASRSTVVSHVPNNTFRTRYRDADTWFNRKKYILTSWSSKTLNGRKNGLFNRIKCFRRRWRDSPESFVRVRVPDRCTVIVFQKSQQFFMCMTRLWDGFPRTFGRKPGRLSTKNNVWDNFVRGLVELLPVRFGENWLIV